MCVEILELTHRSRQAQMLYHKTAIVFHFSKEAHCPILQTSPLFHIQSLNLGTFLSSKWNQYHKQLNAQYSMHLEISI